MERGIGNYCVRSFQTVSSSAGEIEVAQFFLAVALASSRRNHSNCREGGRVRCDRSMEVEMTGTKLERDEYVTVCGACSHILDAGVPGCLNGWHESSQIDNTCSADATNKATGNVTWFGDLVCWVRLVWRPCTLPL